MIIGMQEITEQCNKAKSINYKGLPKRHALDVPHGIIGVFGHLSFGLLTVPCNDPLGYFSMQTQTVQKSCCLPLT